MKVGLLGDSNIESGVAQVIFDIAGATKKHFTTKNYGAGLTGICVVLMCRDPWLNFTRRVRLSKKEKILYMDVMLNLEHMKSLSFQERRQVIIPIISDEIMAITSRYKIGDFDQNAFFADAIYWFKQLLSHDGDEKWARWPEK